MQTYLLADPTRYPHMTTAQLRETFLMDSLYEPGAIHLVYVDLDRTIGASRRRHGSHFLCRQMPICGQSISPSGGSWEH